MFRDIYSQTPPQVGLFPCYISSNRSCINRISQVSSANIHQIIINHHSNNFMKKFLVKYHLADTIEKIVEANSQEEAKLRIYSEAFDDDNFIIESVAIATEED